MQKRKTVPARKRDERASGKGTAPSAPPKKSPIRRPGLVFIDDYHTYSYVPECIGGASRGAPKFYEVPIPFRARTPRRNRGALQVARENVTARIYPWTKFVLPLRTHGALLNRYYEGLERMLLGK